ncbi:helicase-associated domain-containing protein [Flexivirga alba]|uniref:Helicase-associated domain-containing protein n=1 Tax=Flexivirga alba TaxID=702742 RepID=A0ABW2AB01_9MICO
MTTALPAPVDHLLLQADLTAVAPGPLTDELHALMQAAADVESRGGATVYRFTDKSIRRALDTGRSATELIEQLNVASPTPLPQPLEYLISDVARRHGQTRVGTAGCYLRNDDTAMLDAMSGDRNLSALQLRKIAPTVVISPRTRPRCWKCCASTGIRRLPRDRTGTSCMSEVSAHALRPHASISRHGSMPSPMR